jgi:predicted metal-dependent phosphoesterase TrpH
MRIDLQLHSRYSDGYYTPAQLVRFLVRHGIKAASLTDHNTVAGQIEFKKACAQYQIKAVTGLELYVRYKRRTFNVLWYNYNPAAPELIKMLESTWVRRRRFAEKVASRLRRLGIKFNLERFIAEHPGYLPANHLADLIWQKSANRRLIKEALKLEIIREEDIMRYCLFPKVGARLQDAHVSFTRVLKLRKQIGGQLIFCHPGLNNKLRGTLFEELLKAGLDGVELLSPHHGHNTIMHLNTIIKRRRLIASGGSDFHKPGDEGVRPRYSWDWFVIKSEDLPGVSKILDNKK